MKRLVLFVEGQGDVIAVPLLIRRIITEQNGWDSVFLDDRPFRTRGLTHLFPKSGKSDEWTRFLAAAAKTRQKLGGILVLLDADDDIVNGRPFCAKAFAIELAELAKSVGAGLQFSVAVVLVRREYESWLIASAATLAGKALSDGRPGIQPDTIPPDGDLEQHPRGAKEWLDKRMDNGYDPTEHQALLTELVDFNLIRPRMRSFRRLENAVRQLVEAFRSGHHVVTPSDLPPPPPEPPESEPTSSK